jgi:peptidyl-tRNA hydrolase
MNAVMYLILRSPESLPMTAGKAAAQAAHAAVEAYRLTDPNSNLHKDWYVANHYTKIVLQTDDLFVAQQYLGERGIQTALIIDEGRTEFEGNLTPTALGCALVNKDNPHIQDTFAAFKLYKEQTPRIVVVEDAVLTGPQRRNVRDLAEAGKIDEAVRYVDAVREGQKPDKRPLRCRFGWHVADAGNDKLSWCSTCGATWESRYDGFAPFTERRRDLSFGR